MTDRDDALRRELGWTGPEETDYEPPKPKPEQPQQATPPVPSRPPVDFVPQDRDQTPTPPQPEPPPPPFLDPDRPGGGPKPPTGRF
nr:hypothetical protein [Mycobacterium sp. 3519A]